VFVVYCIALRYNALGIGSGTGAVGFFLGGGG